MPLSGAASLLQRIEDRAGVTADFEPSITADRSDGLDQA